MRSVEIPDEILEQIEDSAFATRSESERVRSALAVYLLQEGAISIGKAAQVARIPRIEFELLPVRAGIPVVRYDLSDYQVDRRGIADAEHPPSL